MIEKYFKDPNVVNIYRFGSHVYETNGPQSDEDYIIVQENYIQSDDINIHHYSVEQFQSLLDNHEIQMMECYFLAHSKTSAHHVLKNKNNFKFTVDKFALRISISTISSNSWVKGKKRLIIAGDYDLNCAIKSVFHSVRILDFGIQIALHGCIVDYTSMNYLLKDLWKLSEKYDRIQLWEAIDNKYRKLFNSKSTMFKKLAPKNLEERKTSALIENILKKYNIKNEDLLNELLTIFK